MVSDLPNVLTLARIGAVPVIVALIAAARPWADVAACLLFGAAGITDYLDGAIARARGQTSDIGRMLDPIADKVLVAACLIMLAAAGRLPAGGVFAAVAIVLRELVVSGLREYLAGQAVGLPVTPLAKWKTGLQMAALGLLLLGQDGAWLLGLGGIPVVPLGAAALWAAAGLTLVTGWEYLVAGLRRAAAPAEG